MSQSKEELSKTIQWGEYRLPAWMFYSNVANQDFVSPAAGFKPVAAVDSGNAWQSTTTPASGYNPKSLVLTIDIFGEKHSTAQWLALIHWLEQRGFTLYLCTQEPGSDGVSIVPTKTLKASEDKEALFHALTRLTSFDKQYDYETLAERYSLKRDQVAVLDKNNVHDFFQCMQKSVVYTIRDLQIWSLLCGMELNNFTIFLPMQQDFGGIVYFARERASFNERFFENLIIKNHEDLINLIKQYPDKIDQLIQKTRATGFIFKYLNGNSFEPLALETKKKVIDALMKMPDKMTPSLAAFILTYSPHYADKLVPQKDSWPPFMLTGKHPIFFKVFPDLFNVYKTRIRNAWDLRNLVKTCPEKADELFMEFSHLINTSHQLLNAMESAPKYAETLLNRYDYLICDNKGFDFMLFAFPALLSQYLIEDESRIINGGRLAVCMKYYPQQKKRLFGMYAHKVAYEEADINAICEYLEDKEDIKALLLLAWAKYPHPLVFLKSLSIYQPRLFFWMAEQIKKEKVPIARHLPPIYNFIIAAPERLEWLQQQGYELLSLAYEYENAYGSAKNTERRGTYAVSDRRYKSSRWALYEHLQFQEINDYPCKDMTYLYVSQAQDLACLVMALKKGMLSNLVVLEITFPYKKIEPVFDEFFSNLKEYCPYLQRMILPEGMAVPEGIATVVYQSTNAVVIPNFVVEQEQTDSPQGGQKKTGKLYIANNGLNSLLDDKKNESSFSMIPAGELLNQRGQALPRLRTGIVVLSSDFSKQDYYKPTICRIQNPPLLTKEDVAVFRGESSEYCYFYFNFQLSKNNLTRLLSVDAQETLMGILQEKDASTTVEFFRGDDDFYYVKASKPCTLSYIIKANNLDVSQKKLDALLAGPDPLMKKVSEYRNKPEGGDTPCQKMPVKGDRRPWLDALFKKRAGACRHRCYALWYAIWKDKTLRDRVRLVDIDNNHMRVEIAVYDTKEKKNIWHQVDLGGVASELRYENATPYKPPALEKATIKDKSKEKIEAQKKSQPKGWSPIPVKMPNHVARLLQNKETFQELGQIKDITQTLFKNLETGKNRLLVNPDVTTQAMLILEQARDNIPLFYLDKPGQYGSAKDKIMINHQGVPVITNKDALDLFLESLKDESPCIIMVNWDAFIPEERVALNTLLDRKKSLYGKPLPESLSVISLCAAKPEDKSFLSRHKKKFSSSMQAPFELKPKQEGKIKTLDVQGYPDWKSFLFGPIELVDNQLVWRQGALVSLLTRGKEKGDLLISIKNLPEGAKEDVLFMVRQARAQGFFDYHGYSIPFPESISIDQDSALFSFSEFEPVAVCQDVQLDKVAEKIPLINSILFDYLLTDKAIHEGKYSPIPGLIEQNEGEKLDLFIQYPLSPSQWYCLFSEAGKKKVQLNLYLAPGVTLPSDLKTAPFLLTNKALRTALLSSEIVVSNDAKTHAFNLYIDNPEAFCLAVEDYNYQDLVSWIDYKYVQGQGFYDFKKEKSDLIAALKAGKDVILYGEFSSSLLQALSPLLQKPFKGRLKLVLENKRLHESSLDKHDDALLWLPKDAYSYAYYPAIEDNKPLIIQEEQHDAENVIDRRKAQFLSLLKQHPLLQLVGHTGVGKSHLIEEIKATHANQVKIFHELKQLDDWATHTGDELKVLFIDEANIDNQHLTLFDPLKEGGTKTLLYKGKHYDLGEQHRVVFARNPHDYGGGRNAQKLFADGSIPEFHLVDLPPVFIYHRMLKPIYDALGKQTCITEEAFKKQAERYLDDYQRQKSENTLSASVRNLQEKMLAFLVPEPIHPKARNKNEHFIPTPSTKALRRRLKHFIAIHETAPLGIGLHCFYLEGGSGLGKSELVGHILHRMNYVEAKQASSSKKTYIKMDASLPQEDKQRLLLEAFEKGWIVWLDEGNVCMEHGLEKFVNSLLSGIHPITGERQGHSGFMLILTANSIALEGRSPISPALLARSIHEKMPDLTRDDLKTIVEKSLSPERLAETDTRVLVDHLTEVFKTQKGVTLRELRPKLKSLAQCYPLFKQYPSYFKKAINEGDLKKAAALLNAHPQWINKKDLLDDEDEKTLFLQAAKEGNDALLRFILNEPLKDETLQKTAIQIAGKHHHQKAVDLLKANYSPARYSFIWNGVKSTSSDENQILFKKAQALLLDYTKHNSLLSRWAHFHFRRSISNVKAVTALLKEAKDIHDLLQGIEKIKPQKIESSLTRRINFIQRMCVDVKRREEDKEEDGMLRRKSVCSSLA